MANFYGLNATNVLQTNPPAQCGIGEVNGRVRMLYDKYTFTAAITTSDALYMGAKIPKGARILNCIIKSADLGTTGDINVGWAASSDGVEAADADGFFAALDVNAAATSADLINSSFRNIVGLMKKFTAEVQVVIVPSENTTATSGSIEIAIMYVID